jgi:threonine/homoserine/homoserine lactone efflux protein
MSGGMRLGEFWVLSIHFMMLGISLAVPVGPINLEMIKRGLLGGFWPSWFVGLGAVNIDFLYMFTIFLGLSPFLQNSLVQTGMLSAGILMLSYLGVTSIKEALFSKKLYQTNNSEPTIQPYWTGFLLALMNPFNFVFWFGIYGVALQSIPLHFNMWKSAGLSLFIIVGIIIWNVNIAFTVHFFRTLINETVLKWLTVLAGACLLGFAYRLFLKLLININVS